LNDISTYTLVTTIAVCLLAFLQVIVLSVLAVIGFKIYRIIKSVHDTTQAAHEVITGVRNQQLKNVSVLKLGLFAFKKIRAMKRA